MAIRLIALDLDGTLLDSRGEVSAVNRAAIARARDVGVRIALVTGRRFRDARPIALDLGLDIPLISHNGALTKHARTLEIVAAHLLPLAEAREVLRLGRTMHGDAMVSDDAEGYGTLVYDYINPANHALQKYIAWAQTLHGAEAGRSVRRVDSLEDYLDHAPIHIAYSGTCKQMIELAALISCQLGERVRVLQTLYPRKDFALIDILHPVASKGAGLAAVASEYRIAQAEVMAMGDNHNDLEMLRFAAVPVVMDNAEPDLRDTKDFYLTTSNDEDGVARAIERFVFGESQHTFFARHEVMSITRNITRNDV